MNYSDFLQLLLYNCCQDGYLSACNKQETSFSIETEIPPQEAESICFKLGQKYGHTLLWRHTRVENTNWKVTEFYWGDVLPNSFPSQLVTQAG